MQATSLGRSGSLGAPAAWAVPAPSASLGRSASLPQQVSPGSGAGRAGGLPAGRHPAGSHPQHAAASGSGEGERSPPAARDASSDDGSLGTGAHAGRSRSGGAGKLRRAASAGPPGAESAPAPGTKLEKEDVMR